MNKNLYIISAVIALLATGTSCSREEADLWPNSAAERLDLAVANHTKTLVSAPNGWSMYYFAADDEGGVNFTFKFNDNSSVIIGSRNIYNTTTFAEETSMWEVITDNGPVLSFNSYNTIFHYFSDPDANTVGGSAGVGHGGDYEFMIISCCSDSVVLKGKKTGVYCKMFPLEDADRETYFDKLDERENSYFNSSFTNIWLQVANGEVYNTQVSTSDRTISFYPKGGDSQFETTTIPYVMTNTGIRLYEPYTGINEDLNIQDFVYDANTTSLICTNDGATVLNAGDLGDFFVEQSGWTIDADNVGGTLGTAYNAILTRCSAIKYTIRDISFGKSGDKFNFGYTIRSGRSTYKCTCYGTAQNDANGITFNFDGTYDNNGTTIVATVPQIADFTSAMNAASPFVVTSDSNLNPSTVKLTSKADANNYIVVKL